MHSYHRTLHLQFLGEVDGRGDDPRALLRLGRRLLLVQRFHGVGQRVLLVLLPLSVEHLQRGLLQLYGTLLHLQHVLVLSRAYALLHLLLELHDLLLALAQVALQGSVHGHDLLVDLLQLAVLALLFSQFLVVELVLDGLGLYLRQLQRQVFQQSLLQLQGFLLLQQQVVDSLIFLHHLLLPSFQLPDPAGQALDLLLQVQLILARPLILHAADAHLLLAALAGLLRDLLRLHLLHVLLEVIDLIDIDGQPLLGGAGGEVEVVLGELLEIHVAGLGVAAGRGGGD